MRKKIFTFLLALAASVGLSYADPVGLQVTEFTVPASWQNDQTPVTASDLPGFVAASYAEAGAWTAPTEGTVKLIYTFDEGVKATYFINGVWGQEYVAGFGRWLLYSWASYGERIFYTSDGSTPAVDPEPTPAEPTIVITTNTSQSSYTQGNITITCSKPGDNDGFYLQEPGNETATITNSGSSTISQIELSIGWFPQNRSYVRANGAEPTSSDQYSITFSNVNSNNVTLTITDEKIQIRNVTITLADEGGSASDPTPTPSGDGGKLPGAFSINSDGDYIAFSKGNLQYHCTNHVWQFATNQYDIIGGDNANISDSYDGWVDLFGYGTGNNPTLANTSYSAYSTFTDWGVNAISNGGNEANLWRTLTKDEWGYLFNSRTNASNKYGMATVANVPGVIVLPDVYEGSAINTNHDGWGNNIISSGDWAAYETAGAVFLPVAGYREGTTVDNLGSYGFYWSSTPDEAMFSYKFSLDQYVVSQGFGLRYQGLSVRLVQATSAPSSGSEPEPTEDAIVIVTKTQQSSYTQGTVTISCAAIGDSDGFTVSIYGDKTATITNSDASKIISKIELVPGYSESYHSYVRANGGTPASSSESLITFTNVNSNNVTLSITNEYIQIKEVRITLADNGGSTPAVDPTPTPSATSGIFAYNYDCSRWPAYPTKNNSCQLSGFSAPCVGLNGIDCYIGNVSQGPWKVEFYEMYDDDHVSTYGSIYGVRADAYGILTEYYGSSAVPEYYTDQSAFAAYAHEKLPVYSLSQWNGNAYQVVGYGFICAYAGEGNVVEHAALFIEAGNDYGCFLSGHEHSGSLELTFDYDLKDDMTSFFADGGGSANPVIKLNANFGGTYDWADTEAFTDNGDGTATLSNIALEVGYYYNFRVKVDGVSISDNHEFTRQNPSYVISSGSGDVYYFQADVTGNYSFTWEYATNTLTIGYPDIPTDQDLADAVIGLINAIPNPIAYNDECKDAIDAARAAYDALNADQKALVSNYYVLLNAETTYPQLAPNPSGECGAEGDNLLWSLNSSTGVLTITGSGAMANWPSDNQRPWYAIRDQITSVVLPNGITSIGEKAFRGCTNLASINMAENYPASLTTIKQEVFCNTGLTSITIPATVETIGQDAFYLSQGITDVYCYADPNNLTWNDYYKDDFNKSPAKSTQCHVKNCHLDVFNTNWNTGNSTDVNVTFVGDLPGECGSTPAVDSEVQDVIDLINAIPNPVAYNDECKDAIDAARAAYDALDADQKVLVSNYSTLTDAEDAYAALIPVVTNYSISLDGITENADKVTLNKASAAEGETITLTPAAGYQITAFTASYASAYSVRVTADPNVNVYDATPYVGALPKEFTENVTPGLNGATFHSIEGDDPFTPVPASVLEYVGMNAAKDQMTIRVNDAFSGIIRVNYTYNVENCEWDEYEQQEICMGGTALASVRVVCEAAGGVAPASKDDVTGAYSFTMPAGNVTITATVEPVTPAGPTADMSKNIAIDLRGQQLGGTSSEGGSKYLIIDSENNYTYVDDEPAAYNAHFAFDNFNGTQHGYTNLLVTAPVTAGQYLLTLGGCQFGTGTGNVKNASSEILAEFDLKTAACYDANPAKNIVSKIFTVDAAQTITIDCGNWTPYIALKKMPEIPAFTDFTINFMSDSYTVAEGTLPAGTVIDGTPNTGQTAHGYQNVVATVPVKAGKYRLTLGTCQYGTGTGNVMSETNIELASFDQKTAACYHQNPAENIISMIFDVDQDQHITIDCGNYTPYMKLEAVTSYAVEFALGDAEGTAPAAVDVTIGEDITMPVNKTMYKAGYTLTGWSDGVNTYPIGESFTPDNDVVLTPVFTANEADLLNASTDVSVKWYFGGDNGAPDMHLEGSAGLLVAQATIGDKTVDVKLGIDATSGKFVPQPTTEWAQVRVGTIFTYPYKEGMTVDVHTYSGNVTYYIADGNVTCGTNDYYSYIELTFPAPASTAVVIGDPNDATEVENFLTTYDGQTIDELIIDRPVYNNMYNTLCLPFDMNATQIAASSLNGVEIREFTGASVEGTTLNLSVGDPVNAVVAGRPYFVKYSAALQLDNLHFEDVTINNALLDNMAVTFDGVTFKGTFTPFVMPNGLNFQGGYLFLGQNNQLFWPNTDHPLKPFRAYFYVNVESSTPGNAPKYRGMPARIVEGKNVATGVENAQSANQSTKVIVNGQLIIIKNDVRYNAQGQIVK